VLPTRDPTYGGPVAVVNEYARELLRHGIRADIFPADDTPGRRRPFYFPGFGPLRDLAKSIRTYDLVHIHGLWYAAAALSARVARAQGIPYAITPHGMLDAWAMKRGWLKKRIYYLLIEKRNLQCAAFVHLLNTAEQEASKAMLGDVRTFVLPNGVDTLMYEVSVDEAALTSVYPEIEGRSILLFLGRINFKKGLEFLIPAFKRARYVIPQLHLVIAGPDDGYLTQLKKLIVEHDVGDHVTLTGMVSGQRKRQVLAAAHMFILTSHQEGDSLALKEAMAAGLPTIVSAASKVPETTDYDCGIVVAHDNCGIVEAIIALASDPARRAAMGERAKRLMRSRYGWPDIIARLISHYRVILEHYAKN
jgi:glycosyltransferase involved in cell wall biosynthesis